MNTRIDHIYLSPHLDDTVCSCGGLIREQTARGEHVLVVTLMTEGPEKDQELPSYLRAMHMRWGFDLAQDPYETRREEDIAALDMLGADHLHVDMQGALYRRGPDGRHLYTGLQFLGRPVPADQPQLARIRQMLLDLRAEHPNALFYAPLGAGGHVDHQLIHRAAREMPGEMRFYEEMPYVLLDKLTPLLSAGRLLAQIFSRLNTRKENAINNSTLDLRALRFRWKLQEWGGFLGGPQFTLMRHRPPRHYRWQSVLHSIDIPAKVDAMMQYTSQFTVLFGSREQAIKAMDSYATSIRRRERIPYERQWWMTLHP